MLNVQNTRIFRHIYSLEVRRTGHLLSVLRCADQEKFFQGTLTVSEVGVDDLRYVVEDSECSILIEECDQLQTCSCTLIWQGQSEGLKNLQSTQKQEKNFVLLTPSAT